MMAFDKDNYFYKGKRMFRKNTSHLQQSLFGIASHLPEAKLKKLKKSKEYDFYRLVFCKIDEEDFAVLYSDNSSRPNVEATVKEFTKSFNHKGKLKVRGLFKTMVYAHAMAISINFGRVWRYMAENPDFFALSNLLCGILPCLFTNHSRNKLRGVIIPGKSHCWLEPRQYFRQAA